ncbi:MAG TPA: glycosyltransferase family 39 protein [Pyrinomonadaceae bacterium]|nr:glycosyltransferase family 39 protein [Pyrinomonadaceae bacterium]
MISKSRIIQIGLAALAFILCIVTIYATGRNNADFADSIDYITAARMLVENGSYPAVGGLNFFRAPLFPLFMAGIWSVTGESVFAVKIVQAVLHAVTTLMIFGTAKLLSGRTLVALLAGLLFAVNPFFIYQAAAIQTEALHTFLLTLALLLVIKMVVSEDEFDLKTAAAAGVAFGLGALCKNSPLGICIVLAIGMTALGYRRKNSVAAAAVMVGVMFVTILPWSFYNLKTRGEFILINDSSGFVAWIGNHPANLRIYEGDFASREEMQQYQDYIGKTLAAEQIAGWETTKGYSRLSFKEREGLWQQQAIDNAKAEPAKTARLLGWKLIAFWRPWLSSDIYSMKAALLSALMIVPLFVLGFAGMWISRKRAGTREVVILFTVLMLFVTAVHTALVSTMRLRLSNVDALLTVFAAIAIVAVLSKLFSEERIDSLNRFLEGSH